MFMLKYIYRIGYCVRNLEKQGYIDKTVNRTGDKELEFSTLVCGSCRLELEC